MFYTRLIQNFQQFITKATIQLINFSSLLADFQYSFEQGDQVLKESKIIRPTSSKLFKNVQRPLIWLNQNYQIVRQVPVIIYEELGDSN